jgi:hypothetical protein
MPTTAISTISGLLADPGAGSAARKYPRARIENPPRV